MKIKSLTASFGRLDNAELEFEDGLNIVCAPNEAGKSTWSAFLRAMLYGISTSERDKAGFLADKTKYRPWNGKSMEGRMNIHYKNHDITLQRSSIGSTSPMKKLEAFYSDVMLPVEGVLSDNAGEIFTGVPDRVFDRTAFIRQAGVAVSGDPGLEKRIASLISTGEEHTSFSEADSRLRARQRRLRHNKTGSIPKLEVEIKEKEEKLSHIDKIADELAEVLQEKEKYTARSKELAEDLETYRKLEKSEIAIKAASAKKRAHAAGEKAKELRAMLTQNGLLMNTDDVAEIGSLYSSYISMEGAAGRAREKDEKAGEALENAKLGRTASVLKGLSEAEAVSKVQNAENAEKDLVNANGKKVPGLVLVILAVIAMATGGALLYLKMPFYYVAVSFAVGVLAAALGVVFLVNRSKARKRFEEILAEYSVSTAEELKDMAEEYSAILKSNERLTIEKNSVEQELQQASEEADKAKEKLLCRVHDFFPEIQEPSEIASALKSLADPMRYLPQVELEQARALAEISAITASVSGDIPDEPTEYIPMPSRSLEDTNKAYVHTAEHISELSDRAACLRGEINALGDPISIEAEAELLQEEVKKQKEEYDTLSLAIEALGEANTDLQTKFSPLVNEMAGKIMRQITEGRYEKLVFDKDFKALAKASGDTIGHEAAALSAGTADQIYLSLRLAMAQLLLSGDEPCPVILDDALTQFDDTRCKCALEYLRGLSSERQIILFTCQKRESEMMAGKERVNVITL